jgi:hypothetical protein
VLCSLSSAGARFVEVVSYRGVCGYGKIGLRPEECNKLARPSCACILYCVNSLIAERNRWCYAPLMW